MKKLQKYLSVLLLASTSLLTATPSYAMNLGDLFSTSSKQQDKFLSVDEAFQVRPSVRANKVTVTFNIVKGHYIYRDKLKLILPKGVTASKFKFKQTPSYVDDPKYGKVAVFDNKTVTASTTLSNQTAKDLTNIPIKLKWQGCSKAGLCYPPEKVTFSTSLKKKVIRKYHSR